jgi:hypothetical protein
MKMNDFADAVKNKPNQTQLQANRPNFQNFRQKPLFFDFLSFFLPMWLKFLPPFMRPKLTTNRSQTFRLS